METTENTTENRTVTADVAGFKVIGDGDAMEISTRLSYDPVDPYAVATTFFTSTGPITWVFGRDLLDEGTHGPTGDGDLIVWPSLDTEGHAVIILELLIPDGAILMQLPTLDVHRFLQRTFVEVPHGLESDLLDTEALIEALLDEGAEQ